ncbi:MAG: MFS transporter [Verrucomicrobiota bacterium]
MADAHDGLRPYRAGFFFAFFNGFTWLVVLGTPMILLAEELGASPFVVGLCYAFVFLLLPFQVLATTVTPRVGYKRQAVFCWAVRGFFILPPLGLAIWQPESGNLWAIAILAVSIFFFCLLRAMGSMVVPAWLYDMLPENLQGRYFSTDFTVIGFCGVFTLILCAACFLFFDTYTAILLQYGLAIFGAIAATIALSRLPSAPNPPRSSVVSILKAAPRLVLREPKYRYYLCLNASYFALTSAAYPFFSYYLKREMGIGYVPILYFTALQHFGGFIAASLLRKRIDSMDIRIPFWVAILLNLINGIFWILIMSGFTDLVYLSPFLFPLVGAAGSCYISANFKYLPQLMSAADRPLGIALQTTIVGVITGIASTALGGILRGPGGVFLNDRFGIYLVFMLGIQLFLAVLFYKLKRSETGESVPLPFGSWLNRPFRAMAATPLFRRPQEKRDG